MTSWHLLITFNNNMTSWHQSKVWTKKRSASGSGAGGSAAKPGRARAGSGELSGGSTGPLRHWNQWPDGKRWTSNLYLFVCLNIVWNMSYWMLLSFWNMEHVPRFDAIFSVTVKFLTHLYGMMISTKQRWIDIVNLRMSFFKKSEVRI